MNVAFIIPTGIGCSIGGHAGDATPAAKLIAQCCDRLLLHPNVVNASDINEMPANSLYVEGSTLDRVLEGSISLKEVKTFNKILLVVNTPARAETVNAVNAARSTIGAEIEILNLTSPLLMEAWVSDKGKADGRADGVKSLINQVSNYKYDALAIATPIFVETKTVWEYFTSNKHKTNPWGAIEAKVSKQIADALNKPVAHAPVENDETKENRELLEILYTDVVDRRKAAEVISSCYLHCVLKGLHKAPAICHHNHGIGVDDIDALVTPHNCWGRPHNACRKAGIPIIAVRDNTPIVTATMPHPVIEVQNYLEAAGALSAMRAGVSLNSVKAM